MGCTSAKQVSAVPNGEEGQNKAYSNGDLLSGQCDYTSVFTRCSTSVIPLKIRCLSLFSNVDHC